MATGDTHQAIDLPAVRAHMGDWTYYCSAVRMGELASRVSLAAQIHESASLRDLIQREVNESQHATEIGTYLLQQVQRMFNSLVIAVYGGSPDWYEIAIKANQLVDPEDLGEDLPGTLGVLRLGGGEQLFAIDGQHRLVGMRLAIEKNPSLVDEEVPVIFVAHERSESGLERTRRLFTTLNRYAKPVSMLEKIALDEDDVVAIIVRRLMEEHPLFKDKISLAKAKQIHATDQRNFTSVVALYDGLDVFLNDRGRAWSQYKRFRPTDDDIELLQRRAVELWDTLGQAFAPLRAYMDGEAGPRLASPYRHRGGGHLLFRPIGLGMVVRVLRSLRESGVTLGEGIERISRVPMELAELPWRGLLWNPTSHRMLSAAENQSAARKLLLYAAGGDLSRVRTSEAALRSELAGILNVEEAEVTLQRYV